MSALEIASIHVTPGQENAFVEAYRQGRQLLTELASCRSVRMTRGVEHPATFALLVEWDSVDAHDQDFRATDRYQQWRSLIGPHFAEPPRVVHYYDVD